MGLRWGKKSNGPKMGKWGNRFLLIIEREGEIR